MNKIIFEKNMPGKNDLEELLRRIKQKHTLSEQAEYFIKLTYNELYFNIKKYSCASNIHFLAEFSNNILSMKFLDDGIGFEHEKYTCVNVRDEKNVLNECGRGIGIVREICESLTYKQNGKEVCAKIKLD